MDCSYFCSYFSLLFICHCVLWSLFIVIHIFLHGFLNVLCVVIAHCNHFSFCCLLYCYTFVIVYCDQWFLWTPLAAVPAEAQGWENTIDNMWCYQIFPLIWQDFSHRQYVMLQDFFLDLTGFFPGKHFFFFKLHLILFLANKIQEFRKFLYITAFSTFDTEQVVLNLT